MRSFLAYDEDEDNCNCGRAKDSGQRIVGGKDVEHKEFPWLLKVRYRDDETNLCAGSVITRYLDNINRKA